MVSRSTEIVGQEIAQRVAAFEAAFNRGDIAAVAALYTEDAEVLPPGGPLTAGRPAIAQFWQGVREAGIRRVALHPRAIEASGDLAAEVGTADLEVHGGEGQPTTVTVKYVVVWRRQVGGSWQMALDIWNSDAPA